VQRQVVGILSLTTNKKAGKQGNSLKVVKQGRLALPAGMQADI